MRSCSRGAHDFENAVRHGRAWYTCPRCGQDISLACGMYHEAVRMERELESLHQAKARSGDCKTEQGIKMNRTWNYRVIRHQDVGGEYYAIHEVYYNTEGEPDAHTSEPTPIYASSPGELYDDCILSLEAFVRPVLDAETYEEVKSQGLKNKQKGEE